ncbi:hypothetical protein [Streptomyces longisporoflavus]|uniref:Uncharacterized protein n=1 Tax=Streptomyces longisporoflavus TaxID=28044 RepID=A0ABW7QQG3_9ACTN
MGIDVELMQVTQRGSSPKTRRVEPVDAVQDEADLFAEMCVRSSLPMLNRMDPYRTRILTAADMPQFIAEVDATRDMVTEQRERQRLQAIRALAERCSAGAGLELHLLGD